MLYILINRFNALFRIIRNYQLVNTKYFILFIKLQYTCGLHENGSRYILIVMFNKCMYNKMLYKVQS